MISTIDKAGRVVIPAAIRKRLGLEAGAELEVKVENFSVKLTPSVPKPRVERVKGRLVVRPASADAGSVDVARLVDEERERWPI